MKINTFATRRLWLRRLFAMWAIITWPFRTAAAVIKWIWKLFVTEPAIVIFSMSMLVFITSLGVIFWRESSLNDFATPEEIAVAQKADTCFDYTIRVRAKAWNRAITRRDVETTVHDCKKFWEDARVRENQSRVLK